MNSPVIHTVSVLVKTVNQLMYQNVKFMAIINVKTVMQRPILRLVTITILQAKTVI